MNTSSITVNRKDVEELSYWQAKSSRLEEENHQMRESIDSLKTQVAVLSEDKSCLQKECQTLQKMEQEAQLAAKQMQAQMCGEKEHLIHVLITEREAHSRFIEIERFKLKDAERKLEDLQSQLQQANNSHEQAIQAFRRNYDLLAEERDSMAQRVKDLEAQINPSGQRREGEAIKRVEFLRSEMIAMLDHGIELEKDALKAALPQLGDDGDAVLQVWRKDALERVSSAWNEEIVYGTGFAFFRFLYRLRVTVVSLFISLALLCRKGAVRVAIASDRARYRSEFAAASREMEQKRKAHEAEMARERRSNDAEIAQAKAAWEREQAARTSEMDARENVLNGREKSMEHKIRAYKQWRLATILLLILFAALIAIATQGI